MDIAPAPDDEDKREQRPAAAGSLLRTLTGPQVSVALGIGLLLAVLANRIATPELVDSQARTDILGVIASGGLITNGVYLLVRVRPWPASPSPQMPRRKALCLLKEARFRGSACVVLVNSRSGCMTLLGGFRHASVHGG